MGVKIDLNEEPLASPSDGQQLNETAFAATSHACSICRKAVSVGRRVDSVTVTDEHQKATKYNDCLFKSSRSNNSASCAKFDLNASPPMETDGDGGIGGPRGGNSTEFGSSSFHSPSKHGRKRKTRSSEEFMPEEMTVALEITRNPKTQSIVLKKKEEEEETTNFLIPSSNANCPDSVPPHLRICEAIDSGYFSKECYQKLVSELASTKSLVKELEHKLDVAVEAFKNLVTSLDSMKSDADNALDKFIKEDGIKEVGDASSKMLSMMK